MSFRSNQTLSGLLNLLPTIQYAFLVLLFLFFFQRVFPHFDQLKCVVCVYVVCCVKRLMQAFHVSIQSWSYKVLSLHHGYQTFPLAVPPVIIFFHWAPSDGCRHGRTPACFGAIRRRAVLSLCYHDANSLLFLKST